MTVSANALARDIETLIHPYTNLAAFRDTGPLIIETGKGIHVYDTSGKPYIEGMVGLWCTALGYGNQELIEAGQRQPATLASGHLFGGKKPRSGDRAGGNAQGDLAGPRLENILYLLRVGSQ